MIAQSQAGTVVLEFREWLDAQQVNAAQHHEDQREHLIKVIGDGWEQEYQPQNVVLASIELGLEIAAAFGSEDDPKNLRDKKS